MVCSVEGSSGCGEGRHPRPTRGTTAMRIFLTGATGLIGSAVLRRLVEGGHSVTALVRSPARADLIRAEAVTPLVGDLARPQAFTAAIAASDGVIHAGAPHDDTTLSVDEAFTMTALAV